MVSSTTRSRPWTKRIQGQEQPVVFQYPHYQPYYSYQVNRRRFRDTTVEPWCLMSETLMLLGLHVYETTRLGRACMHRLGKRVFVSL